MNTKTPEAVASNAELGAEIARKVSAAFDGVNWTKHSFTLNGVDRIKAGGGELFYPAHEIDAAIDRLNSLLKDLRA